MGLMFSCGALQALVNAGGLDTSFVPQLYTTGEVQVVARASTGQMLVGGDFDWISGQPAAWLAQANNDGSVDGSFNPSRPPDASRLLAIAAQADGKVLIGYSCSLQTSGTSTVATSGSVNASVIRVNADGSPDTSFQTAVLTMSTANHSQPQLLSFILPGADDKILIGGGFTGVNGTAVSYLASLNADGTVDSTFVTTVDGAVECALRSSNGSTVIGGQFTKINTVKLAFGLARLTTTGDRDKTFVPRGKPRSAHVCRISAGMGTTLLLGTLTETLKNGVVQGQPKSNLEMVGSTGGFMRTYAASVTGLPIGLELSGSSQVVMMTTTQPTAGVIPLRAAPTVQPTAPGYAVFAAISSSATTRVAAPLTVALSYTPNGLYPTPSGLLSYGFSGPGTDATPTLSGFALVQRPVKGSNAVPAIPGFGAWVGSSTSISQVVAAPGSRLLVAGNFSFGVATDGTLVSRQGLAKLATNGGVDPVFAPFPATVLQMLANADGGATILASSSAGNVLFQVTVTGTPDPGFTSSNASSPLLASARVMVRQQDGKIVIGGAAVQTGMILFLHPPAIVRLFANGTPDQSFAPLFGAAADAGAPTVDAIQIDADGALLVSGEFATVNGVARAGMVRLLADGSVDAFNLSVPPPAGFSSVLPRDGGYLLTAPSLVQSTGPSSPVSPFLGTINSGAAYAAFGMPDLVPGPVIAPGQAFGVKLIAGNPGGGWVAMTEGLEDQVSGNSVSLVRLGSDGSLDRSFTAPVFTSAQNTTTGGTPLQPADYVQSMIVLDDGSVVVGGSFWSVNGEARSGLARLLPGSSN